MNVKRELGEKSRILETKDCKVVIYNLCYKMSELKRSFNVSAIEKEVSDLKCGL